MNNRLKQLNYLLLGIALLAGTAAVTATPIGDTRQWTFRVYLGDAEIGNHNFTVTDLGGAQEMRTLAEFNVKFLFFNAYQYRHQNVERWGGSCLQAIESQTDANGDLYSVVGSAQDQSFVVSTVLDDTEGESTLPGCVMTFAYWNPDFLRERRLLNTQTGEYIDVEAELVGDDVLTVRGNPTPAYRYRLTGENLDIELWYSLDREWLALESVTDSGRRLRYELI